MKELKDIRKPKQSVQDKHVERIGKVVYHLKRDIIKMKFPFFFGQRAFALFFVKENI